MVQGHSFDIITARSSVSTVLP